jgi:hypothetical protein
MVRDSSSLPELQSLTCLWLSCRYRTSAANVTRQAWISGSCGELFNIERACYHNIMETQFTKMTGISIRDSDEICQCVASKHLKRTYIYSDILSLSPPPPSSSPPRLLVSLETMSDRRYIPGPSDPIVPEKNVWSETVFSLKSQVNRLINKRFH